MRLALFAAAVLTTSAAHGGTYVALDVGVAHRAGAYDWKSPPAPGFNNDPTPVQFDARVYGTGVLAHFALGGTFRHRWAIAGELGAGVLNGGDKGIEYGAVGPTLLGRLGVRLERSSSWGGFLRVAAGLEWIAFGASGLDVGARDNVWKSEGTFGPYVSGSAGIRGRHVGGLARVDFGRATSTHATYWPATFSLALDVVWR